MSSRRSNFIDNDTTYNFAFDEDVRPPMSVSGDIIMGSPTKQQKLSSVTPLTTYSNLHDDDLDDEYGYPILKQFDDNGNNESDDSESENMGVVGMKWRIRFMRVLDSEEQWRGVCEIYFHWKLVDPDDEEHFIRKRRGAKNLSESEKNAIKNIKQPDKCPNFVILNEEESNSIEEMYYFVPACPDVVFGYLAWVVVVHERLELEVRERVHIVLGYVQRD